MNIKYSICIKLGKLFEKISEYPIGMIYLYRKSKFEHCGENVSINKNGIFTYKNISIGNDVFIGANAVMQSNYGRIIVGNHVAIGPYVKIWGGAHDFQRVGEYMSHLSMKDTGEVIIEDDCWIGGGVIILPRVKIGKGSVVAAGSIVTKDVPAYSIYMGTPQNHVIKRRFTDEEIIEHEKLLCAKE